MSYSVKGKLHKKFETERKSDKLEIRDFVIKTDEQYPQYIKFQLMNDKTSQVDGFNEGQNIEVSFNLRGRESDGKFFTNLQAWKVVNQ
jgi:hypothetical protein